MQIFIASMVAAFGVASFAAAALVWDRRRLIRLSPGASVGWVSGLSVLGIALMAGSCAGLFVF